MLLENSTKSDIGDSDNVRADVRAWLRCLRSRYPGEDVGKQKWLAAEMGLSEGHMRHLLSRECRWSNQSTNLVRRLMSDYPCTETD